MFGSKLPLANRYARLLAQHGVDRGLIGPREVDRLWERHLLNSAVISRLVPADSRVLDIGSGAGLPGVVLALARPDLDVVLVDPMARRVRWLEEVIHTLGLSATVVRGRAETKEMREALSGADVVTARAVAPLGRLAEWCLPLLRPRGQLLAMKGESAAEELDRDRGQIERAGGAHARIERCGVDVLDVPTTVVVIERTERRGGRDGRRRARKDRDGESGRTERRYGCST
ncbi:MAG: 16S rRNA (guanine(527)-N(7))-methyltransferase RsmG [Pseudonocardiaceae bacterium]|nr:16S rRNA (guanine(527)-N(7))-methyltransferase RsmG [Pseudonocardiaceae bacterium]